MMETAAGVFVVAAIATSGHDNFAAEDEIPVGPAVALSVNWKHQRNNKNRIPGAGLAEIEFCRKFGLTRDAIVEILEISGRCQSPE